MCTFMMASRDRKSTRLNSSHLGISYAVFCLKKRIKSEEAVLDRGEGRGGVGGVESRASPWPASIEVVMVERDVRPRFRHASSLLFFKSTGDPQDSPLFPTEPLPP